MRGQLPGYRPRLWALELPTPRRTPRKPPAPVLLPEGPSVAPDPQQGQRRAPRHTFAAMFSFLSGCWMAPGVLVSAEGGPCEKDYAQSVDSTDFQSDESPAETSMGDREEAMARTFTMQVGVFLLRTPELLRQGACGERQHT